MHAWLCENPTGIDALQWKELPTPQPRAGEVLLEIKAASLNFPDILIVQNKYQTVSYTHLTLPTSDLV